MRCPIFFLYTVLHPRGLAQSYYLETTYKHPFLYHWRTPLLHRVEGTKRCKQSVMNLVSPAKPDHKSAEMIDVKLKAIFGQTYGIGVNRPRTWVAPRNRSRVWRHLSFVSDSKESENVMSPMQSKANLWKFGLSSIACWDIALHSMIVSSTCACLKTLFWYLSISTMGQWVVRRLWNRCYALLSVRAWVQILLRQSCVLTSRAVSTETSGSKKS